MAKNAASSDRNKFLDGVRDHLVETKARLLDEIDTDQKAQREGNKDEGMDAYDLASEERDREINFILSDRERAKIKDIDDALSDVVGRLDPVFIKGLFRRICGRAERVSGAFGVSHATASA